MYNLILRINEDHKDFFISHTMEDAKTDSSFKACLAKARWFVDNAVAHRGEIVPGAKNAHNNFFVHILRHPDGWQDRELGLFPPTDYMSQKHSFKHDYEKLGYTWVGGKTLYASANGIVKRPTPKRWKSDVQLTQKQLYAKTAQLINVDQIELEVVEDLQHVVYDEYSKRNASKINSYGDLYLFICDYLDVEYYIE